MFVGCYDGCTGERSVPFSVSICLVYLRISSLESCSIHECCIQSARLWHPCITKRILCLTFVIIHSFNVLIQNISGSVITTPIIRFHLILRYSHSLALDYTKHLFWHITHKMMQLDNVISKTCCEECTQNGLNWMHKLLNKYRNWT